MKTSIACIIGASCVLSSSLVSFYQGREWERGKEAHLEVVEMGLDTLTQWQMLQMAIMKTESEFNPLAQGPTNDLGVMQITPIYVQEVNRLYGTTYNHNDARDIETSIAMFNAIQGAKNPKRDVDKAISLHNPCSSSYLGKVKRNMAYISRYEECRKVVKSY